MVLNCKLLYVWGVIWHRLHVNFPIAAPPNCPGNFITSKTNCLPVWWPVSRQFGLSGPEIDWTAWYWLPLLSFFLLLSASLSDFFQLDGKDLLVATSDSGKLSFLTITPDTNRYIANYIQSHSILPSLSTFTLWCLAYNKTLPYVSNPDINQHSL